MIEVLTWVTIVYALVLVVVLAVSLSLILYFLWSIGTTLGTIHGGLEVVRDQTAPLSSHVGAINSALEQVGTGLSHALDDLMVTDVALGTALGDPTEQQPAGLVA